MHKDESKSSVHQVERIEQFEQRDQNDLGRKKHPRNDQNVEKCVVFKPDFSERVSR